MPNTAPNPPLESFLSIALTGSHDFLEWLEILSDHPTDAGSIRTYIGKVVKHGYFFLPVSVELLYSVISEALRQSGIIYDIPAAEKSLVQCYAQELVKEDEMVARKKGKELNYDQSMQKVQEHVVALTEKLAVLKGSHETWPAPGF